MLGFCLQYVHNKILNPLDKSKNQCYNLVIFKKAMMGTKTSSYSSESRCVGEKRRCVKVITRPGAVRRSFTVGWIGFSRYRDTHWISLD